MTISEKEPIKKSPILTEMSEDTKTKETEGLSSVECGIAISPEDKLQRLRLVTKEYRKRNYIELEGKKVFRESGIYHDEYESIAHPLISKMGSDVVASLRLIPNTDLGLPINNEKEIWDVIYPEWKEAVKNAPYEWSQLAKASELLKDSRPVMGLIRAAFAFSRENRFNEGVAVMDDNVRRLMNGPLMKFNLVQIGEPLYYMGSQSTPIYFNFNEVIKSSYDGGLHELSKFLDTGKASGFEWYKGK